MIKGLIKSAAVAAMVLLPVSAHAVTITTNELVTLNGIEDGNGAAVADPGAGLLSLTDLSEFNLNFSIANNSATPAGFTITQDFRNDTSFDLVLGASTVLRANDVLNYSVDVDGNALTLVNVGGNLTGGDSFTIAQGAVFTVTMAADDILGGGTVDLNVAAVPVPAAGLLLLTALGGIGIARRKKKAA